MKDLYVPGDMDLMTQTVQSSPSAVREKILVLESEMMKFPQVEITPVHYFAKGLYAGRSSFRRALCSPGRSIGRST